MHARKLRDVSRNCDRLLAMDDVKKQFSVQEFVTGTFAGISGGLAGYPLDTIRVHMQMASGQDFAQGHKTWLDSTRTIVSRPSTSLFSFFRGASAPAVGVILQNSFLFGATANLDRFFRQTECLERHKYTSLFLAGTLSGALNCLVASPIDLVKIQMQVHPSNLFPNTLSCIKQIVRVSGLRRGLMFGFWPTLLRDAHSYGVYFASYQFCDDLLVSRFGTAQSAFVSGGIAGILCWVSSYPIDIVKSRMQGQDMLLPFDERKFQTMRSCFRYTISVDGWGSLWRGLNIALFRGFLVNGVVFVVYDWGNRVYKSFTTKKDSEDT